MKIKGKKPGRNETFVVIPRQDGDFVFKLNAVPNYNGFEELCPEPVPPLITRPGQDPTPDTTDLGYLQQRKVHGEKRYAWLFLQTIKETEGLEWETVDYNNPNTWLNVEQEILDSGFNQNEYNYLLSKVIEVNSLSEAMLNEARARFLLSLEALAPQQ